MMMFVSVRNGGHVRRGLGIHPMFSLDDDRDWIPNVSEEVRGGRGEYTHRVRVFIDEFGGDRFPTVRKK